MNQIKTFEKYNLKQCLMVFVLLCSAASISFAAGPNRLPEGAVPGAGPSRLPDGAEPGAGPRRLPEGATRGDGSTRLPEGSTPGDGPSDPGTGGDSGDGGSGMTTQPVIDPTTEEAANTANYNNAFKAMTFNAKYSVTAAQLASMGDFGGLVDASWFEGRNEAFYAVIEANDPDIVGIQEAASPDQQNDIANHYALDTNSSFTYYRWDNQDRTNKNPILVNTDRFTVDYTGVEVLDVENDISHDQLLCAALMEEGEEHGDHDGTRHINWLVLTDKETKVRFIVYNTHYIMAEWEDGATCAHEAQSVLLVAFVERQKIPYGNIPVVLLGDFNNDVFDEPLAPSMSVLVDAGFIDTFRQSWPDIDRPETAGVDHIFISPGNVTNYFTYYDKTELAEQASDHKSLSSILEVK